METPKKKITGKFSLTPQIGNLILSFADEYVAVICEIPSNKLIFKVLSNDDTIVFINEIIFASPITCLEIISEEQCVIATGHEDSTIILTKIYHNGTDFTYSQKVLGEPGNNDDPSIGHIDSVSKLSYNHTTNILSSYSHVEAFVDDDNTDKRILLWNINISDGFINEANFFMIKEIFLKNYFNNLQARSNIPLNVDTCYVYEMVLMLSHICIYVKLNNMGLNEIYDLSLVSININNDDTNCQFAQFLGISTNNGLPVFEDFTVTSVKYNSKQNNNTFEEMISFIYNIRDDNSFFKQFKLTTTNTGGHFVLQDTSTKILDTYKTDIFCTEEDFVRSKLYMLSTNELDLYKRCDDPECFPFFKCKSIPRPNNIENDFLTYSVISKDNNFLVFGSHDENKIYYSDLRLDSLSFENKNMDIVGDLKYTLGIVKKPLILHRLTLSKKLKSITMTPKKSPPPSENKRKRKKHGKSDSDEESKKPERKRSFRTLDLGKSKQKRKSRKKSKSKKKRSIKKSKSKKRISKKN